MEYYKVTLPL